MNAKTYAASADESSRNQSPDQLYLAELYAGLAEALAADASRPDWLGLPGREWPLWQAAGSLAAQSDWPEMREAVEMLAEVPRATAAARQLAYQHILLGVGTNRPPILMYESQYLNGRFLGPATFALQAIYRQAGLEMDGAELPDYACVELEFISYLAEREASTTGNSRKWRAARRRFLAEHAGKWMTTVGRELYHSGDRAWSALGKLLIASLNPPRGGRHGPAPRVGLPHIKEVTACTLCGFCAQVCPTHALQIEEDRLATRLLLQPAHCIHCRKCERVCQDKALDMLGELVEGSGLVLRESTRVVCPRCGRPTVSEAELAAVVSRLGEHPAWLDYCTHCR